MSGWAALAGCSLAGAVWSWQAARLQLPDLDGRPDRGAIGGGRSARPLAEPAAAVSVRTSRLVAAGGALALLLVLPIGYGWLPAALVAAGLRSWLARQPGRAAVQRTSHLRRQLPMALELTAAALAAGATSSSAVTLAASATGPPLSRPLLAVAASLRLGAAPEEAWRPALAEAALRPLGRLALRSTASGAAMAAACRQLAAQQREAQVVEAQVAIKRAGVLTVLPLALCFLPAFVLVGVVPIVLGLLSTVSL